MNCSLNPKSYLPPIKVHVWGGLGSQLFALNLVLRIQNKFPQRKIMLVFHSSGVTERFRQIPSVPEVKIKQVFDYASSIKTKISSKQKRSVVRKFRSFAKRSLRNLGLSLSCNNESEILQIKPWTIDIRGHYTELNCAEKDLLRIYSIIFDDLPQLQFIEERDKIDFGIHLRLGDLLELTGAKSPKSVSDLNSFIELFYPGKRWIIFSDSDESVVKQYLADSNLRYSYRNLDILLTMYSLIHADVFIGTNSKLSTWIVAFRSIYRKTSASALPAIQYSQLEFLLSKSAHYLQSYVALY